MWSCHVVPYQGTDGLLGDVKVRGSVVTDNLAVLYVDSLTQTVHLGTQTQYKHSCHHDRITVCHTGRIVKHDATNNMALYLAKCGQS